MVVTQAREASSSHTGGHLQPTEQQEAAPSVANLLTVSSPPPTVARVDPLAMLTQQVQALAAMIHRLQEQQYAATQHQPRAPSSSSAPSSQQSARERPSQRGAHRHHASSKEHHRETSKRPRSPFHRSTSPKRCHGKQSESTHRQDSGRRSFVPKKSKFTPLLAPRSHILMEIEGEPFLQRPPPMKEGVPRDRGRYCHFHRDYGHDTEDCRLLKKAIEGLVQQGHLRKFVRGKSPAAPGPSAPPAS